ncbi:MAG: flagellar cap protein FliD N-terminal domain-containing protein, partial [Thermotogota bacterium]|nr:flagellar cap protein FliD N-terminal domain-containing protein [Thermotogota bacterium]
MADFDLTNYISSSVANRTSVSGLASGIDTESVIQSIIDAESAPLQKLTERKESMTNRQKALNELSEELTEFRTFTNNWRLESNFLQYQTTSSNESIATIQATAPAKTKNFSFAVDQVARNETYFSADYVSGTSATQLQNLGGYANGVSHEGALTLTIDGTSYDPITYTQSNTLSEVIAQIKAISPDITVDTVNSAEGLKLFISGADASIDISLADTGDFLQVLGMTPSYESGYFANGLATNTLADFNGAGTGLTANGQLTIMYNGSDVLIDYETTQTL